MIVFKGILMRLSFNELMALASNRTFTVHS